jgi:Ca2+-binding EF-hand superfamily protein
LFVFFSYSNFKLKINLNLKQNGDGSIDKEELKIASRLMGFSIADDLNELLFKYCDQDKDDKINFVEFCNFLCYKDSMKLGVSIENVDINSDEIQEIRDNEGRILFYSNDLVHKNNIETNELVIRTINSQLDERVGNWKSTYDQINDAPFKKEPISNYLSCYFFLF